MQRRPAAAAAATAATTAATAANSGDGGGGSGDCTVVGPVTRQTAVLVRGPHIHGHRELTVQARHAIRDLQVYHGQVPVLREEQKGLAELHPAQPVAERVFRQDTAGRRRRKEGQLLDIGYVSATRDLSIDDLPRPPPYERRSRFPVYVPRGLPARRFCSPSHVLSQ